ncbi:MAG TPA: CheR family methyltransferase [Oculatellaceae cyanobacterium]|jgi:two-component system CheB/CheR fusion protein
MNFKQDVTPEFLALLDYIKNNRGFDFTNYKSPSLIRRIRLRMKEVNIDNYSEYIDYLAVQPTEFNYLFNTILINVTCFFRDRASWDYLASDIIPVILDKNPDKSIRIWSAGCASGQEAYTLAMVLAEIVGQKLFRERVKIFATDVDEEALSQARQGSYSLKEVKDIPDHLLTKYFDCNANRFTFNKELRRCLIFGRHNLMQDAPIAKVDLLVCRNSLMYFNVEGQSRLLDRFHFALNDDSFLFLGKAETLFTRSNLFTPIDLKRRIYIKTSKTSAQTNRLFSTPKITQEPTQTEMGDGKLLYEAAFKADTIAQVVVDIKGCLFLANENAYNLFGLNSWDIGRPFQDLEISYRPVELRSQIDQVAVEQRPITLSEIKWTTASGEIKYFDIEIIPLLENQTLLGTKIIFTDVTSYQKLQDELEHSNQELEAAYEELQSANEELETTNEELQSANEELETTNEELQSTNEELETTNEELQSTNEELQTLNQELLQRSSELNQVNLFLESILTTLRIGVIVLDDELCIHIWNSKATDMWGLRLDEVQGKHLLNLDIGLPLEQLRQPIKLCLSPGGTNQELVLKATNRRGKSIECKVSLTAIKYLHSTFQGVIILMEEII